MILLIRFTLVNLFLFLSFVSLFAQKNLTLEQALEQTLTENKQGEIDYHAEQAELFQRKVAKGLRSPQFSFSATYSHLSKDIGFDFNGLKAPISSILEVSPLPVPPEIEGLMKLDWGVTLQKKDFVVLGALVEMPIFMGGKINAANRAAEAELNIVKEQTSQNKNALHSELIERYYGVSLAMQAVDVRQEVLDGMELHLEDAMKLEKEGIIAKVERLYAQMKYAEANTALKKAEADLSTVMTALKSTLNIMSITGDVIPISSMFILNNIDNIDYFKELAIDNNNTLKQVDLKKELAVEGFKIERADFMPKVVAIGGVDMYNYQLSHLTPKWVAGVGVSFNIFDGLRRENKVRSAKSRIKQIEAIKEKATTDIQTLIEKLYNELATTKDIFNTYHSVIEFSEEYLRAKELAFQNGVATSKDVVDAQLLLSKNKLERLQTAFKYDVALAKMLENCGASDLFLTYKNTNDFVPVYFMKNEK